MANYRTSRRGRALRWLDAHSLRRRPAYYYYHQEQFFSLVGLQQRVQEAENLSNQLRALSADADEVVRLRQAFDAANGQPNEAVARDDYLRAATAYQAARSGMSLTLAETGGTPAYMRELMRDATESSPETLDELGFSTIDAATLETWLKGHQQHYESLNAVTDGMANAVRQVTLQAQTNRGQVPPSERSNVAQAIGAYRLRALRSAEDVGSLASGTLAQYNNRANPTSTVTKKTKVTDQATGVTTETRTQETIHLAPTPKFTRRWRHWREQLSAWRREVIADQIEELERAPEVRATEKAKALAKRWEAFEIDGEQPPQEVSEIAGLHEPERTQRLTLLVTVAGSQEALAELHGLDSALADDLQDRLNNGLIPDHEVRQREAARDAAAAQINATGGPLEVERAAQTELDNVTATRDSLNDLVEALAARDEERRQIVDEINEGRPRLRGDLSAEEEAQLAAAEQKVQDTGRAVQDFANSSPDAVVKAARGQDGGVVAENEAAEAELAELKDRLNITDNPAEAAVSFENLTDAQLAEYRDELDQLNQGVENAATAVRNLDADQLQAAGWTEAERDMVVPPATLEGTTISDPGALSNKLNELGTDEGPGLVSEARESHNTATSTLEQAQGRLDIANRELNLSRRRASDGRRSADHTENAAEAKFSEDLTKAYRLRQKLAGKNRKADRRYQKASDQGREGLTVADVQIDEAQGEVKDFYDNNTPKPRVRDRVREHFTPGQPTPGPTLNTRRRTTTQRPAA